MVFDERDCVLGDAYHGAGFRNMGQVSLRDGQH